MRFDAFRRGLGITTATAAAIAIGLGVAAPASAAGNNACPGLNSIDNFTTASNVGAAFTSSGNTTEYTFVSLVDENPVNGVPGLAAYCVYTDPAPASVVIDPAVVGANGQAWVVSGKLSKNFAFLRPGGAKSNIPLKGQTITMGTATWADPAPTTQTILLHIDDPAVCSALYGTALTTCFVKPTIVELGPVCDKGSADTTGVGYTALPRDAVDCGPPSYAFEGNFAAEFGDAVQVSVPVSKTGALTSLTVLFNSYGCSVSGRWDLGNCLSDESKFFSHPITASVYKLDGTLIAQSSLSTLFDIHYRPSADPANCGPSGVVDKGDASRWFNHASGACEYSLKQLLVFDLSSAAVTLQDGDQVIWTVAFNTTHAGYVPIGEGASCFGVGGGCGYDSLNVGYKSYPGAPYAGTDLDEDIAYVSNLGTGNVLTPTSGWTGNRPLGQINIQ